jgi:hypothetical protein
MSVKDFKFVSPGVFINEIDNSFVPKSADAIGPVIIGRAPRGPAGQPVKVQSYSEFVEVFGETVPGNAGGDVSRDTVNLQSPMYGTYSAKAFLNANVAPLTYVRLLGEQSTDKDGTAASKAGWRTDWFQSGAYGGGAFGLWVAKSSSAGPFTGNTAMQLAAIWYNDNGGMALSGSLWGEASGSDTSVTEWANWTKSKTDSQCPTNGALICSDASGVFTVVISGSNNASTPEKISFSLNDANANFLRKKFNTNPQLRVNGDFYPTSAKKDYWLGESFEQELRDKNLTDATTLVGVVTGIQLSASSNYEGPANMLGQASREAVAGWFISQDTGTPTAFNPETSPKGLFRLRGRGHGSWLSRNCKVSIENIRQSTTTLNDYGTFSVVIRSINDTDNNVQVMERFDGLDLNPASPNYIGKQIGDMRQVWSDTDRRLVEYGQYPNRSKFVWVQVVDAIDSGGGVGLEALLPFGYHGPPIPTSQLLATPAAQSSSADISRYPTAGGTRGWDGDRYVNVGPTLPNWIGKERIARTAITAFSSGSISASLPVSCSLEFPSVRLRHSASDGGMSSYRDAYFGYQTTRTSGSSQNGPSAKDFGMLWTQLANGYDPGTGSVVTATGLLGYSYIFTLDDVATGSAGYASAYYSSGSRSNSSPHQSSVTFHDGYEALLNNRINKFTAPFWGGTDGFNIRVPDPLWNGAMDTSTSTNINDSVFYTWKRAIDTVADPEVIDMNVLSAPGLSTNSLTAHMINTCESRADALALIDIANAYKPASEGYESSLSNRLPNTARQIANNMKSRRLDSSYGAAFYPWVQTQDGAAGQLVWVPPTVAMMGVLASSERKSKIWFAPAGFNRATLSDGAAGIPITKVVTRLTSDNRDTLYDARINPIASFSSTGIVVFGQKTLQERASALDRINVRRLVIYLKKQISILSTKVLFEQNVQATWNRFKGLIEPFLANVKTDFGITDYRLILDENTTTADLIDRNILYAKIMIKPARAIEYIAIDFAILSTGASFDD